MQIIAYKMLTYTIMPVFENLSIFKLLFMDFVSMQIVREE